MPDMILNRNSKRILNQLKVFTVAAKQCCESRFQNAPFWPISALGSNFNPRNTMLYAESESCGLEGDLLVLHVKMVSQVQRYIRTGITYGGDDKAIVVHS